MSFFIPTASCKPIQNYAIIAPMIDGMMLAMPDALEKELDFFESKRAEWVQHHEGKYALVKEHELADFFDSAEAAYSAGIAKWGNVPFLIKRVLKNDPVEHAPALAYGLLNASF